MVKRSKAPEVALDLFGKPSAPEETRAERIARIVAQCHPCGTGCQRILIPGEGLKVHDFDKAICYACQLSYGYVEPNKHDRAKYEHDGTGWRQLSA